MRKAPPVLAAFLVAVFLPVSCARWGGARRVRVGSPDGKNVFILTCPRNAAGGLLLYAVTRSSKPLLQPSALRIRLSDGEDIAAEAKVLAVGKGRIEESFSRPWGKSRIVRDNYSCARVRLESRGGIFWELELRAYDEGVAFRYGFPGGGNPEPIVLEQESTEFRLAGNPNLLLTTTETPAWSHEHLYTRTPLALVPAGCLIEMPVLAVWPDGTSAALTEAAVRDFAGMYLRRDPDSDEPLLQAWLSPRLDGSGAAVRGSAPLRSPWRVIMISARPGGQVESNLLACLNHPPSGDFSWLRPGKSTWHWWNGTAEEGLPLRRLLDDFEYHRRYIDFCARHGIAYHSVVADTHPWYAQTQEGFAPGPDTDVTRPRRGLDLQSIISYAESKGVGIRLWVHWRALEGRLEEAFSRYEDWGVRGLMVDFLDRDDQEMVRFCERVLDSAGRHKLHIQFHGSFKPSGEDRTYPNLFNREGVLNLEYLKGGMKCDPQHNVDVAFTRSLAGPTDYHLGGFRSVSKSSFWPRNINPVVIGTRCHHLALYVVYENPMPMVCDSPDAYEGQPGFEFIEEVPTTWDETHFVTGEAGEYMVVARRSGSTWYLGGVTNDVARRIRLPLEFLGPGAWKVKLFRDGSMDVEKPNAVRIEEREVSLGRPLEVDCASGGGFAAIISLGGDGASQDLDLE
jgi:alpha-glucosidase